MNAIRARVRRLRELSAGLLNEARRWAPGFYPLPEHDAEECVRRIDQARRLLDEAADVLVRAAAETERATRELRERLRESTSGGSPP